MDPIYGFEFTVPAEVVDGNRHVNNVAYVQWMQDAAIQHATAAGCTRLTQALGATWVVRSHRLEYLRPAFVGDVITVQTWVAGLRLVRSLRRYQFIRAADHTVLVTGETHWVFVDAGTGRPRAIPREVKAAFTVVTDEPKPGLTQNPA